jgi:hypothetical protein
MQLRSLEYTEKEVRRRIKRREAAKLYKAGVPVWSICSTLQCSAPTVRAGAREHGARIGRVGARKGATKRIGGKSVCPRLPRVRILTHAILDPTPALPAQMTLEDAAKELGVYRLPAIESIEEENRQ